MKTQVTFENFFLNTFANFEKISNDEEKMLKNTKPNFISKSRSKYWYINGYVYRHSRHFSRDTRTCAWFLEGKEKINNVSGLYGKCKLEDFVQINTNAEVGKKYKIIYAPRDRRGVAIITEGEGVLQKITQFYYVFDNFKVHKWTLVTLIETKRSREEIESEIADLEEKLANLKAELNNL